MNSIRIGLGARGAGVHPPERRVDGGRSLTPSNLGIKVINMRLPT